MKINDSTVNILWNSFLRGEKEAAGANDGDQVRAWSTVAGL